MKVGNADKDRRSRVAQSTLTELGDLGTRASEFQRIMFA